MAGCRLDLKTHHRLVDRANLLDIQRPVRDALTIEQQQLFEHLVDRSIRHTRRDNALMVLAHRIGGATFEKREAVRVKQHPVAARQMQITGLHAIVDHAEEHQQLRPRPIALLHRIRVERGILAQPLVESRERVAVQERLILRQHLALLRVEQENQAQNHRQQPAIDLIRLVVQRAVQQRPVRLFIRRLHTTQQGVERVQHLLRQALADLVLKLTALIEQRRQPLVTRQRQQTFLTEQQAQGGNNRSASGQNHIGDAKIEPAGILATRSRDQPQRRAVKE